MKIRAGDFIVRVNGIEGEISALASELRTGSDVCITVQRAAQDDAPQTWKDLQASIMRSRPGPGQQPPGPGSQSGASAAQYNEPIVPGNSSSGYPGPVGLPDQQSNPRPKAPGLTAWGAPGYQPVGMPNFRQGLEHSQTQWQGKGWPGSQWALPDSLVDAGPPPVVGAGEQGNKEGVEALSENAFSFEVSLIKPERARLGIDVMPHTVSQVADFCGLTVKRVSKGGVVDEWNQQCRDPRAQVCPGDRIVRVNGVSSDFAQMWEMLCTQRELHVTVRRSSNQTQSFSHGQQGFGVGPVQLPGRGAPMLENTRLALTSDRAPPGLVGTGSQAAKSPPAISLPNQAASIASIARGAENVANVASISRGTGQNAVPTGQNAVPKGFGLGKTGTGNEDKPGIPESLHSHLLLSGSGAGNHRGPDIRFDVTLDHTKTKRVGMDVIMVSGNSMCGFVVERVMEGGRVDTWNKQSRAPYTVQTGDYIVQVNGIGNWQSLSKMAEEFVKEGQQVSFTIQRGPPVFSQPWTQAQSEALNTKGLASTGGKQSKQHEADKSSAPKASSATSDAADTRGDTPDLKVGLPMPKGFTKVPPPPPIEALASSIAARVPPPPPPLPPPSQVGVKDIKSIAALPKESVPTKSSASSGPPMPPPPPKKKPGSQELQPQAERREDLKSIENVFDRQAGGTVALISRGPYSASEGEDTKAPAGLKLLEEALAYHEAKEDEARKAAENPTTLLAGSLQLRDEDLVALLRMVLDKKPHLRVTVSKALMLDTSNSGEDGRVPQAPQAPTDVAMPTS